MTAGRLHAVAVTALLGFCGAGLVAAGHAAFAQGAPKPAIATAPVATPSGPPNALQGFSQNRDKPIRIDASRLEVRDKDKIATFFGDAQADVKVVQGDTTLRSRILVVYYEKDESKGTDGKTKESSGPGTGSQVKRLEAKQNVVVTQKDQIVTGDAGVFDMKTNTATVSGNVVMTQCENVVKGDKLIVDMTTGVSRVENNGGRVQSVLMQSQPGGCGTPPAAPAKR
jgi:lipopolysaccharide export system protein LptA